MAMVLRYGLEWDRDYFMDIVFWINSVLPFISLLTIYPANLYLLTAGPSMNWEIRTAYLVNLGTLAFGIISIITTFYILMMRMHQLTVAGGQSRWKLSWTTQLIIYVSIAGICTVNMVGFVLFGTDVNNYEELVKEPELAWLVERGGTLLLYGEPGKDSRFRYEILFLLVSAILFLPFLLLFIAHALIYLNKNEKVSEMRDQSKSSKTQILTHRLFATFSLQTRGAIIFFILPLGFILTTSVVDFSENIPGRVFAILRFVSGMLLELNPPQFAFVFIMRNETHRQILIRRLMKLSIFPQTRKDITKTNQPAVTWLSSEA